jgi:hypothetical protein
MNSVTYDLIQDIITWADKQIGDSPLKGPRITEFLTQITKKPQLEVTTLFTVFLNEKCSFRELRVEQPYTTTEALEFLQNSVRSTSEQAYMESIVYALYLLRLTHSVSSKFVNTVLKRIGVSPHGRASYN